MGTNQTGFHWKCECCGRERTGRREEFSFCDAVCYAVFKMMSPLGIEAWRLGVKL